MKPRDYAPRRLTRVWFEGRTRVPRHSRRFPDKGNGRRGRCVQTVSCELFRAVATPPFGCSASLLLSRYRCWKPGVAFASVPPSLGASCRRYTSKPSMPHTHVDPRNRRHDHKLRSLAPSYGKLTSFAIGRAIKQAHGSFGVNDCSYWDYCSPPIDGNASVPRCILEQPFFMRKKTPLLLLSPHRKLMVSVYSRTRDSMLDAGLVILDVSNENYVT